MCNDITAESWPDLVRDVHARVAAHVRPYLASISRTRDNQSGKAHGSGVYLEFQTHPDLLTCEHVVQSGYANGYRIAHLPRAGGSYFAFTNPWIAEADPVDLALTCLDSGIWSQSDRFALPIDRVAITHDTPNDELLTFCGHPGAASYFSRFTGEPLLESPLIPYTARQTTLPSGFDPRVHFALQYEIDLSTPVDGSRLHFPQPPGMSGAPIWDTGFVASHCSKNWDPSRSRLIGLATRWVRESSCIIAIKAERVRRFLFESHMAQSVQTGS